ncbi:MAG: DUF1501 domain-containing protein [Planctomycetota bacterium]|nr:DUF1501 domain-containing protein [Planctomycetota bacterium]
MAKIQPTGKADGCIDCDGKNGLSRRSFFKTGVFGFMGLGLLDLMKANLLAEGAAGSGCDSVILVWLAGGPSHIDTFDPKPGQPTAGPFKPINTSADGIQICEHFPQLAKQMKHGSLVRSLTSKEGSHERATYEMHTGYKPLGSITHPSLGSLVIKTKGRKNEEIPAYVSIGGTSFGAGFLGAQVAPFYIGDPNNPTRNLSFDREVTEGRFRQRVELLKNLDMRFAGEKRGEVIEEYAVQFREAVRMMYSKSVEAFDLKKEDAEKIKKYGENGFGRSMLIARRLVDQGVRFVECSLGGWDNHNDIDKAIANNAKTLDPALSNLVEDLNASGQLKRTLVICTGEFGRTPKVNGTGGRDHYPRVFSAFVAGGGVKQGYVYGSSDATGTEVKDLPVKPGDLHATMFDQLGIDFTKEFQTDQGRPIKIVNEGKPLKDLIA